MRKTVTMAALAAATTLVVAACGSGSNNNSSSGAGNSASPGASSSGSGGNAAGVQVGVILPDTTSSTRYTLYDKPLLEKAFNSAGIKADIQNAQGSTSQQSSIAQSMLGEGIKVLIIDSIDQTSGAAIEQEAKNAGVQVIDYDRVNLGGSAPYYVSFDNEGVGKLQGQTLVKCLQDAKVSNPRIIEMDGGTDVDNNAVLFKQGARSVLVPLQQQGKLKIVSDSVVKGWDVNQAAPTFTQALTAAGGKIDGVLAANDDIANAVIGVLKSKGLAGIPVTGQDAGVEGLQNILRGYQCMTVFKNVTKEADAASKLAIALIKNQDPSSAGVNLSSFHDPKGNRDMKAVLLTPEAITKANVQDVIDAGQLTKAQVCKGIENLCTKAGIT